jgi:UDP-N-acetylglucosamine 1-carboxyvinyltransferase
MSVWHVNGGKKLFGTCFVQGSKNAALPIMAASIMTPAETELMNVPCIADVGNTLRILRSLGCYAEQDGGDVYINSIGLDSFSIPRNMMEGMRSSVIFLGALLARCGEARISLPGGCNLGARPIDLHLMALRAMGAEITDDGGDIVCRCAKAARGAHLAAAAQRGRHGERHARRLRRRGRDGDRRRGQRAGDRRSAGIPAQAGRVYRRRRHRQDNDIRLFS